MVNSLGHKYRTLARIGLIWYILNNHADRRYWRLGVDLSTTTEHTGFQDCALYP